ncbi:methyltransferase [Lithospermum erythrorhizon]|uniref:Methyltransferase n=1 Tax=Lithospermum erythrorhizon TaxID=34254 RepID=A0AAV3P1R6_LITER
MMSRRPATGRRPADGGSVPLGGSLHTKSRPSPVLSVGLVIVGTLLVIGYVYRGSGVRNDIAALSKLGGGASCSLEVQNVLPFLKTSYGDSMRKVLHVGPDSCSVVSKLLKEDDTEAWGIEPYDLDDVDENCKSLMRKGIIRVADVKFALPYRANSFSHVIVSDALDYLSPKYLNTTAPELARVAADGVVILAGHPGQQKAKTAEMSKFGRPWSSLHPSHQLCCLQDGSSGFVELAQYCYQ